MVRRWEYDWISHGMPAIPSYIGIARLFENDDIKALIEFVGTSQRYSYTLRVFMPGARSLEVAYFRSLDDAKAYVDAQV